MVEVTSINLTPRWTRMGYHPEQHRLWTSRARFRCVPGGRRSGKTELAKRRLVKCAMGERRHPDAWFFACAPTHQQAKDIFWQDLKSLSPRHLIRDISEAEMTITYYGGARLCVRGMDVPQRVEGRPISGIVLDEFGSMKPTVWYEHVRPALTDRLGWAWFTGVPEGRNHYYDICHLVQTELKDDPEWDVFHWTSEEVLPIYLGVEQAAKELAAAKRDLDALTYDQEFRASFISFQGAAYYNFEREIHCHEDLRRRYSPQRELIFCFDFNVEPGTAVICQEMQKQPHDPAYLSHTFTGVIGEVWIPRNSNTQVVCRELAREWRNHEGRILLYGDPAGGQRGTAKTLGNDWDIVEQEFKGKFSSRPLNMAANRSPSEKNRVNSVNKRLRTADGSVSMQIDPVEAQHTVKDFEGVRWREGSEAQIEKRKDPNLTHLTDGLSYYIIREFPLAGHSAEAGGLLL